MLGKVLKYELRATARETLPFFGLALVASGVMRLLFWLAPRLWEPAEMIIMGLGTTLGTLMVVAVGLLGLVIPIVRFYRGMVSGEGILSFTLPVKTGTHITGRVISGSLFGMVGILVAVACAFLLVPGMWESSMNLMVADFSFGSTQMAVSLDSLPLSFWLSAIGWVLALVIMAVVSSLVQVYVSIAVGQRIARNKVAGSIIGYLLVNAAQGFGMMMLMFIPAIAIVGANRIEAEAWFLSWFDVNSVEASLRGVLNVLWGFTGLVALINLLFTGVEWWLTWYMLDKKLNLT